MAAAASPLAGATLPQNPQESPDPSPLRLFPERPVDISQHVAKGQRRLPGRREASRRKEVRQSDGAGDEMRITIRDLMVPAAAVVNDKATVAAARDLMLRWNAGEVYVVDARRRLVGVVPDYEFLKAELGGVTGMSPVSKLVSARVESVDADSDVATVLGKFREGWCGRMAVTSRGKLAGRLTRSEVLRLIVHLRMIADVTEATAEAAMVGPHFKPKRERLSPVRKMSKGPRARGGRKLRRLAAG